MPDAAHRMLQLHVLFTWPKTPRQDAPLSVGIWLPKCSDWSPRLPHDQMSYSGGFHSASV